MLLSLPCGVLCCSILPHLSLRALQSLDTAYTNKNLRSHLRSLWKSFTYEDDNDGPQKECDILWLHSIGARIIALTLISSAVVRIVPRTPSLRKLNIHMGLSTSWLLRLIQACPQLEVLRLKECCYSDDNLIAVARHCHQLHTISWGSDDTNDAPIQALCDNCPHLRHIHCEEVTDTSLISIANTYPHLQSITIKGDGVTDAGLLVMANKCHELISLTIRFCYNITSRGVAALWFANPSLSTVVISYDRFLCNDNFMLLLQCSPRLKRLYLKCSRFITDAAVIAVAEHCPQLNLLDIRVCRNISDDALIALGQHCHELKSIDISCIKAISDVGISALATGCPLLQEFIAWNTNIADAGVIALTRGCRDLRMIDISECEKIGFDAISAIAENCPLLSYLDLLRSNSVDDTCLYAIAEHCRNLTKLNVSQTKVSDATAVQTVLKSCRMLTFMTLD